MPRKGGEVIEERRICGLRRKMMWFLVAAILTLALAGGVGLGLGLGIKPGGQGSGSTTAR
jgi:hypothetical protein